MWGGETRRDEEEERSLSNGREAVFHRLRAAGKGKLVRSRQRFSSLAWSDSLSEVAVAINVERQDVRVSVSVRAHADADADAPDIK
jgi:hypothetical protein